MRPLSGIQLYQLMPTSGDVSSRGLQCSVLKVLFLKSINTSLALEETKFHTLRTRKHSLYALFLVQVYLGSKFCLCVFEIVGLLVPARYVRDFALLIICSLCNNYPSARRA
jgi:hypothetical protein